MKYLWSNTGTVQDLLNLEPEELRSTLMDHFKYDAEMVGSLSADELEDLVYDNISKFNNMDLTEFEEEWLPILDKQTLNGWVLLVGPNHGWPVKEQAVPDYYINDPDWYEDHEISLLEDGGKLILEFDEQAQFKMYAIPKERESLKTFVRMCMSRAIEAKEEELTWDFEDDTEFYKNELIEKAIDGVVDDLKDVDVYHHYVCEYCDFSRVPEACTPMEAPVGDATMIDYNESLNEAEEGRQGFIVWQSGGSLGDKFDLEDKIFDTREDAQAAIKEWKASYGKSKSYYKPEARIYKYKGKTMKEIRAEWNKADESLNENFKDDSNKFIDFISQYIQNNESDLNIEVERADKYKTQIVITPDYDDIYQAITFYSNGCVDVEEGDMGGVNNEEEFNSYEEFINYFKATLGDDFDDDYDDEYDESLNEKLYPEYIDYFKNNYDPHYKDMVLQNIDLEHSTMVPTTPEEAKKFSNAKTLWNSDFVVGKCNGVICAPYALVSEKVLQKLGMTPDEFVDNAEELYIVNRKANDIGFYRAMAKRSDNSAAEYDDQARAKRIEAAKHRAMAAKIKAGYDESLTEAKAKKPEILKAELEEIKDLYNSWGADAFYTVPYKQFKQEFPEFAKYVIEAFLKEVVDVKLKDYSAAEVEEMWQADDDRDRLIKESDWESLFNGAETLAEGGKVQWERLL